MQRYALRFTISDATLDSLKLPRSTAKPKQDLNSAEQEHRSKLPVKNSEVLEHLLKPDSGVAANQEHTEPEDMETEPTHEREQSSAISTSSTTPESPLLMETTSPSVQPKRVPHQETRPTESPPAHQKQPVPENTQPQTKDPSPQKAQVQLQPEPTISTPPSAPSRPLPLLVAKPYCQPKSTPSGHKPIKVKIHSSESNKSILFTAPCWKLFLQKLLWEAV